MLHPRLDLCVSHNRIVAKKGTAVLVALVILAFGLTGTGFSGLYVQNQFVIVANTGIVKASYGFPLSWHGYLQNYSLQLHPHWGDVNPPKVYWLSLGSLLLDAAFWFAISFFACVATMKSVKILLRTIASKVVVTYFLASASFSIAGLSLYLFSYEDLGLRLYCIGLFLVAATFYQSLIRQKKEEPLKGNTFGVIE